MQPKLKGAHSNDAAYSSGDLTFQGQSRSYGLWGGAAPSCARKGGGADVAPLGPIGNFVAGIRAAARSLSCAWFGPAELTWAPRLGAALPI